MTTVLIAVLLFLGLGIFAEFWPGRTLSLTNSELDKLPGLEAELAAERAGVDALRNAS